MSSVLHPEDFTQLLESLDRNEDILTKLKQAAEALKRAAQELGIAVQSEG